MRIDCKGMECPKPVIQAIGALKTLKAGETLTVEVDNTAAVENLTRLAGEKNCKIEKISKEGSWDMVFTPQGSEHSAGDVDLSQYNCDLPVSGPFVLVVATDEMGQGDPKLGHTLIKSFFYAVAQMDDSELPNTILFFNGGAKLTIEGSEVLEDIKELSERGVEILTCGTCLDFYGIKEKLAVGGVTNMYSIAEKMFQAGKVVRI